MQTARWRTLALVFLIALAVRGGAVAFQFSLLEADPDAYRRLAIDLRSTGVYGLVDESSGVPTVRPTAFRPPLYPGLLAILVTGDGLAPSAVAIFHVLLGAATVAVVFELARRWELGRWSYLAAGLTALDPILLNQSAVVMTETLATLLAVVGWAVLARLSRKPSFPSAAAAGAILGLAVLCRPTFFFWLASIALWLAVTSLDFRRWSHVAAMVAAASAMLAPWTLRNYLHFDKPIFATTHGGYTIWLANNDWYYDHLRHGRGVFDAERLLPQLREIRDRQPDDEVLMDQRLYEVAKETISRRPGDFLYATAHRVGDLWRWTPRKLADSESTVRTLARYAVAAWYGGVFLLAAAGVVALGRGVLQPPWVWGVLLCVSFTCVHAVYWTDMRMRAPLAPVIALAAAVGARKMLLSR